MHRTGVVLSSLLLALLPAMGALAENLDGHILSIDSPDMDDFVVLQVGDVVQNSKTIEIWVELTDNKRAPGTSSSGPPADAEGTLYARADGVVITDAAQVSGDGLYSKRTLGGDWAEFSEILALGDTNGYGFEIAVPEATDGPYAVYFTFFAEGTQPFGFDPDASRYEVRDALLFDLDERGNLVQAYGGDLVWKNAFEILEFTEEHYIPGNVMTVLDSTGQPVEAPQPWRGSQIGGFPIPPGGSWNEQVDIEVCFSAMPSWSAEGQGFQGDRRPALNSTAWNVNNCNDGYDVTPCFKDSMPLKRMRVYLFEEYEGFYSKPILIPDSYVSGPGPLYTDDNGCVQLAFDWGEILTNVEPYNLFPVTDDYPDLIVTTMYEGMHPSLTMGGYPETYEPIFEIAFAVSDGQGGSIIDNVAHSTPTMDNVGWSGGYFGGATGTAHFPLNDYYLAADKSHDEWANLFLIATESFEVAGRFGSGADRVQQAFWCTTLFPGDGDPANDCRNDRLTILHQPAKILTTRYRRTGEDEFGVGQLDLGPLIWVDPDGAYRSQSLGHEIGHHVHDMAFLRADLSQHYNSEIDTFSHWNGLANCQKNKSSNHGDWCLEFQATATVEGWADFWGVVTWLDPDAEYVPKGDSSYGGALTGMDLWPTDGAGDLVSCRNPIQAWNPAAGEYVDLAHVANFEGLVSRILWDLYDVDDGVAGNTETLNDPAHVLRFVAAYDASGTPTDYPVPRDDVSLSLSTMVDAWSEVGQRLHYYNGSANELSVGGSLFPLELAPAEWSEWTGDTQFYEMDWDAPNLADWYDGLYWGTGWDQGYLDEDVLRAGTFLMESGCLWTFNRD